MSQDFDLMDCGDVDGVSLKRQQLLERLDIALGEQPVTRAFWACCHLAFIKPLESLVEVAERNPSVVEVVGRFSKMIASNWAQQLRASDPSSLLFSADPKEAAEARQECKKRDGGRCVITKMAAAMATQLFLNYPPDEDATETPPALFDIPGLLEVFWGKITVAAWKNSISTDLDEPYSGIGRCDNMVCLSPDARAMWAKALFALKPSYEEEDDGECAVTFYWLAQYPKENGRCMSLLDKPVLSNDWTGIDDDYWLGQKDQSTVFDDIRSGQTFLLTVEDPRNYPLPNHGVLELQWILNRVVAMSGELN